MEAAGRHENSGTHLHHAAAEQQAAAQQARMNSGLKDLLADLGTVNFSSMIHFCLLMFVWPRVWDLWHARSNENGGTHLHHAAAEQQDAAQQAWMNSGFKGLLADLGTVDFSWMILGLLVFV